MSTPRATDSDDVVRRADAHQIARAIGGQDRRHRLDHAQHHLLRLADGEAADRIALEADIDEAARRFHAQLGIIAALHDAEQRPARRLRLEGALGALRPAQREPQRAGDLLGRRRQAHAFVELHLDVGP